MRTSVTPAPAPATPELRAPHRIFPETQAPKEFSLYYKTNPLLLTPSLYFPPKSEPHARFFQRSQASLTPRGATRPELYRLDSGRFMAKDFMELPNATTSSEGVPEPKVLAAIISPWFPTTIFPKVPSFAGPYRPFPQPRYVLHRLSAGSLLASPTVTNYFFL